MRYQKRSESYVASLGFSPLSGQIQNPGSRPPPAGSLTIRLRSALTLSVAEALIVLRTTSHGITAMAYQLAMFLPPYSR
ncbi:hypothetical protein H6G80_09915 [Nostoc sp. FACHB-87]|uniref:hypothetical protein n=1 Tax=Nostocaceae TaxID=1162 RepID=UPI001687517B|nr:MULTISPECIES: hypothetical protein [Nostocaceae]MBD2298614.1 hypothetical protein [Nostoc sp. FACHB-190]MBD2454393.1 hypothetical protein [Nostoc sp. FACHB-87]MBD2474421.1 hypothetical protein [Anabaena sp. FACHB-83]